ncbi:MAG: AMP-binding protein [Deltaproteobacteria bacterium]|nr:AMP-binding protein [Deltaproteobacteria bacterium]
MLTLRHTQDTEGLATVLLESIRALLLEIRHQAAAKPEVRLDSTFDHDLGLDSLARVELFARLEKQLDVTLPERTLTDAETPRDLLRVLASACSVPGLQTMDEVSRLTLDEVAETPLAAANLVDALRWHCDIHPDRPHIQFYADRGDGRILSYGELLHESEAVALGLQRFDLQPGDTVVLMLQADADYFFSFFGVLLAGGIPVPLYPAPRASLLRDHLHRHLGVLKNCRAVAIITQEEAKPLASLLKRHLKTLKHVTTRGELSATGRFRPLTLQGQDTAFLQYTSGSTGQPKGVVLSHANLLANIRGMGMHLQVTAKDVFVSWLPLYHDMGLIGAWLGSLYYAALLVIMSPFAFIARPHRWLWAIHRHGGTLSAAPNFGYELCLRRLKDAHLKGLDLGSWRAALNGAEPVSPKTVREFGRRFAPYGFRAEAMMPVYGLAEDSVGLTFPPLGRGVLIDTVERGAFESRGQAIPDDAGDGAVLEFASCGAPLPGHQVRVVGPTNHELPERQEGRLQFQGPSATSGYFHNPQANKKLFCGQWLDTGDLAYIANGEIHPTGRVKDIIIRAGRNIYPHELEEAISSLNGIRAGRVTAFGSTDLASGTERLIVLAETRLGDEADLADLRRAINRAVTDLIGTPADDVVLAPPHTVLMTSSGKVRRAASRKLYEQGRIGKQQHDRWWVVRLFLSGMLPWSRRAKRVFTEIMYGVYARSLFYLFGPLTGLIVIFLPKIEWRWSLMRTVVRVLARLTATHVQVHGSESLATMRANCIYVANHASYLDSYILVGYLPRRFSFVAKAELRHNLLFRTLLNRIKTGFVERFDARKGVDDFERLASQARGGRSYLFFPEGTFTRSPGLLKFHLGAFVAAAEGGLAVVPIAIQGTRSILRGTDWLPHRGNVTVHIGTPICPEDLSGDHQDVWRKAVALRNAARTEILKHCGEPDLVDESIIVERSEDKA